MSNALQTIDAHGGLAAAHELQLNGVRRVDIDRDLTRGRIQRVRQGWYARVSLDPVLARAARVGGRLTCSSALARRGVWVHDDQHLHVAVAGNACRLRSPDAAGRRLQHTDPVTVHWNDSGGRSRLLADDLSALAALCGCAAPDLVTATADSLLRAVPHQAVPEMRSELEALADRQSPRYGRALRAADGICESGIETLFWLRMQALRPRRQVRIPGVGRVDFLLGDRLVIEVDGREFHSSPDSFEADRRRDAALSSLGYRVLRFSYRQIMHDWEAVASAVWGAVARGDRY